MCDMVATRRKAIVFALLGASCTATDGPTVDALDPQSGEPGQSVTVYGSTYCGARDRVTPDGGCDPLPAGTVHFGIDPLVSATPVSWTDEAIVVAVPAQLPPGDVLVVVTVDGRSSNGVSFRVR